MDRTTDNAIHIPKEWTFENASVAKGFNLHVREQLPWYDLVTGAVAHIARHYIPQNGMVYDIGASTGNIGRSLEAALVQRQARLVPIEPSAEMCARYDGPGKDNLVQMDACRYHFEPFDVAICYLVLMFMPVGARAEFIAKLKASLKPGGAIIIVDKCQAATGYQATVLWRLTLAGKVAAGVEAEQIIAKELSLGGVQRPLDPAMLGDDAAEWFRFGEFAGWVTLGTDTAKQMIYSRLKVHQPGPGYCHFPADYPEEYFQQLTAERIQTKFINGHPTRIWVMPKGKRNEALDCRVYGLAALHILNPNLDALRSEQERQNLKKQETEPPASKTEGWIGYDDWNFN